MKKLILIVCLGLTTLYANGQANDFAIDNGTLVPTPGSYPGTITFGFVFYSEGAGDHLLSSDDLAGNYSVIKISLTYLDGSAIIPTGTGANLFNWSYDPATSTFTGKSKDITVMHEEFYPIEFRDVPTTIKTKEIVVGFNANLTPPGDLLSNDITDDRVSLRTSTPLPVKLVSFTGKREGNTAILEWMTSEETNSDHFEIQRSTSGKDWISIGRVDSHGESKVLRNYTFTDAKPFSGANLYRLRMVDKDETFAYSSIRNLTMEGSRSYVYPNPASGSFGISSEIGPISKLTITDLSGKVIYQQNSGSQDVNVSKLQSGMYVVKMQADGNSFTQKIVVKN